MRFENQLWLVLPGPGKLRPQALSQERKHEVGKTHDKFAWLTFLCRLNLPNLTMLKETIRSMRPSHAQRWG